MFSSTQEDTPHVQASRASQWLAWAVTKARRSEAIVPTTHNTESASNPTTEGSREANNKQTTESEDSQNADVDNSLGDGSASAVDCAPLSRYGQFMSWVGSKRNLEASPDANTSNVVPSTSSVSRSSEYAKEVSQATTDLNTSVSGDAPSSIAQFVSWIGSKRKRSAADELNPKAQGVVLRKINADNETLNPEENGYTGKWVRRRASSEQVASIQARASAHDSNKSEPANGSSSADGGAVGSGLQRYMTSMFAMKTASHTAGVDSTCTPDDGSESSPGDVVSSSIVEMDRLRVEVAAHAQSSPPTSDDSQTEHGTPVGDNGEERVQQFVHTTLASLPNVDQQATMQQHATQLTSDEAKSTWEGLFQRAGRPLVAAVLILFEIVVTYKRTQAVNKAEVLRFAVAVAALVYVAAPIDLVPDVVPVAGLADDFVVVSNALFFIVTVIPRLMGERAEVPA